MTVNTKMITMKEIVNKLKRYGIKVELTKSKAQILNIDKRLQKNI